jgi:glycosyltransferase involved in cell wall biosynthesis
MSRDVAVVIPTLRRPESLTRTLCSVFDAAGALDRIREIVVADNAPEASAREAVDALRLRSPAPLVYVHVPTPGVATARNSALRATDAPLIAFIDDDEEAQSGWLSALLSTHERLGADVTFGPIQGRIEDREHWARGYLEGLFSRLGPATSGPSARYWGCGNSLMTRAAALPGSAPFDFGADQTGGEDDVLFAALRARGGRFAWAADAWVIEHAPAHRATIRHALRRAFAYGQSPCQDAARRRDPAGVAKWMIIGAAQTVVYGVGSAVLSLLGRPERAAFLDRTARGLGKLFWTERFEPKFYGAAEVRRTDIPSAAASLRPV